MQREFIEAAMSVYGEGCIHSLEILSGSYALVAHDAGMDISHHVYESSGYWRMFSHARLNGEWRHTSTPHVGNNVQLKMEQAHEELVLMHTQSE